MFLRFLVQLSNRRHLNPSETRQLHQIHLVVDQCLDQIGATGRFGRRLPVGWFDSNVAIGRSEWSKGGTKDDFLCARVEDIVCHCVSHILANAYHVPTNFHGFRRVLGVIELKVNLPPKEKRSHGLMSFVLPVAF